MSKECLQKKFGPTPCFVDTGYTECNLSFCPVLEIKNRNPNKKMFSLLHSHCVMSTNYGQQHDFEEGKGEFLKAISSRVKNQ